MGCVMFGACIRRPIAQCCAAVRAPSHVRAHSLIYLRARGD
jgi:hypothetical protein